MVCNHNHHEIAPVPGAPAVDAFAEIGRDESMQPLGRIMEGVIDEIYAASQDPHRQALNTYNDLLNRLGNGDPTVSIADVAQAKAELHRQQLKKPKP